MKKALQKFTMFHGKPVNKVSPIDVHVPKELIVLGRAFAIEYVSDKLHGGGDGKKAVYRHRFETPALLCMDEKARKQLYIIGRRLKVTGAGIEN